VVLEPRAADEGTGLLDDIEQGELHGVLLQLVLVETEGGQNRLTIIAETAD
jgi:hypothetical protein